MGLAERLADYFDVAERGSDVRTETIAGITTFLTMSYIIVVNPAILSQAIEIEGYAQGEVLQMLAIVTILASAVAILVMAFWADRPFGLAPGMGLNAFFAFTVVLAMGIPWQTALAAVFVEGLVFIAITALGARRYVIELFPEPVKFAVGAGIGVFLLLIGLQEMNVVVPDESTGVYLGQVAADPIAMVALAGLAFTFMLWARGVKGSIILGILTTALAGWALSLAGTVADNALLPEAAVDEGGNLALAGLFAVQYDVTPLVGAFVDGLYMIEPFEFLVVVFVFFFVDFFDTAGTLIGVSQIGGFLDEEGNLPEMDRPLMADAIGTTFGAMIGTSTVTTYIESSTGIEEGGRTGLTALVVAVLFLLALVAVPIVAAIPLYASHLALVVVGIIMLQGVTDIDWQDPRWAVPGGLTITLMPLTFSIANGIAAGIISYPLIKSAVGEYDDVHVGVWLIAIALGAYYYVRYGGVL